MNVKEHLDIEKLIEARKRAQSIGYHYMVIILGKEIKAIKQGEK